MANIIDGIDVSSCTYHNTTYKDFECINAHLDNECKNNPNCYYKQLKRAEQENETLERTCNELRKRHSEDTARLSAEVMELKAELQTEKIYSSQIEEIEESLHHEKAENEKLKEQIKLAQELSDQSIEYFGNSREEFKKKSHRYKQALMDIREIVSEQIDNTDEDDELMFIYGAIYNRINEVIGAE